ncbi:MAG: carboxypeptidase regulatory-like domain-containing protein [Flavobacteriales bacterium]|nr:MAG: carboxypeptidase regulatory-like domain-containing protein [Flavobacteriales bacterium]
MRIPAFLALSLLALSALGAQLHVKGVVTDAATREPLADALVRVYKDGVRQHVHRTGANGHYGFTLDNGAEYVIRFSMPGRVTKCFAIDTHGPAWEDDRSVKQVEVEMTLFEQVDGLDLGFFDMPMGMGRFTPMTGFLAWNKEYEARVQPEAARLQAEAMFRRERLAQVAELPVQ